jgi:hypothetical protein
MKARRQRAMDRLKQAVSDLGSTESHPSEVAVSRARDAIRIAIGLMGRDEEECRRMDQVITLLIGSTEPFPKDAELAKATFFTKDREIFDWCCRTAYQIRKSQHETPTD